MTESPKHGAPGEQPDVTATGATGAGGDAAGTPPRADSAHGERHHTYYEGGAGASSEPGGEDEFDHTAPDSNERGAAGASSETEGTALAEEVRLGVSVRGALGLVRAAKTYAAAAGRHYVTPDDVKALAEPVLAHRLVLDPEAEFDGVTPSSIVSQLLIETPPPSERIAV